MKRKEVTNSPPFPHGMTAAVASGVVGGQEFASLIPTALSPNFSSPPLSESSMGLDDKIVVMIDRLHGWQLRIAEQCLIQIPHGAFASLSIAFSYFETISQLCAGATSGGQSKEAFYDGIRIVFPELSPATKSSADQPPLNPDSVLVEELYNGFRNGLYHQSMTRRKTKIAEWYPWMIGLVLDRQLCLAISPDRAVFRRENMPNAYAFAAEAYSAYVGPLIVLNPYHFIPALLCHLATFEAELLDASNDAIRTCFEQAYDAMHAG